MAISQRYLTLRESFFALLPHVQAVSFDVFDTLFVRTLHEPEALFDVLGARLGVANFRQQRSAAQAKGFQRMHRDGRGEINLEDIYDHLPQALAKAASTGELEQMLELDMLRVNPEVAELFHEARAQGKQIAWTSDMYLPESFFHTLANRHNLLPEHFLISSACGCTKRDDGALFTILGERLGIEPQDILHIGDNPLGDVQRARERGLKALHYQPPSFVTASTALAPASSIGLGLARYASYQLETDPWWQLGWQFGGPVMLAFLEWIQQRATLDRVDRILFVARDGFLLHELHQQTANAQIKSVYLRGSRVSFSLAALNEHNFTAHAPFLLSGAEGITLADLFARIGIELPDERVLQDLGLSDNVQIGPENQLDIERFFCSMRPSILRAAREARRGLQLHLLELNLQEGMRVAFVDVGWSGTTQKAFMDALHEMLPLDVVGYYLGLSAPAHELQRTKGLHMHVFTEEAGFSSRLSQELYRNRAVAELFFSAPHPTTIGYRVGPDGQVVFIEDTERGTRYSITSIIELINSGISAYALEANLMRQKYNICNQTMAMSNFLQLVLEPTDEQVTLVGVLYNWDAWSSTESYRIYFAGSDAEYTGKQKSDLWPSGWNKAQSIKSK
jgi:predicted HAD superfamily hydrolase